MNINNPNDLYQFLMSNGFVGICPEAQNLVSCMDALARMCSCDPIQAKTARYNQCIQNYMAFTSKAHLFTSLLLTKVIDGRLSFYFNGQLLTSITR